MTTAEVSSCVSSQKFTKLGPVCSSSMKLPKNITEVHMELPCLLLLLSPGSHTHSEESVGV